MNVLFTDSGVPCHFQSVSSAFVANHEVAGLERNFSCIMRAGKSKEWIVGKSIIILLSHFIGVPE